VLAVLGIHCYYYTVVFQSTAASGRTDAPPMVRKTATVSVAGRGGVWASGAPKRVEVDARPATQTNKKSREKPLPTSVDEMPKLEERSTKVQLGYLFNVT